MSKEPEEKISPLANKQSPPIDKDIKEELEKYKIKAEEYLNGWKRAKADYINFKKEVEERQRDIIEFANLTLVLELLPLKENFKKAFEHIPEKEKESDWVIGIKHIQNQLDGFLEKLGVEEIKTVGENFDPEKHEAVSKEKRNNLEENIVIKEIGSGYLMRGRVIKPAKVIVSG